MEKEKNKFAVIKVNNQQLKVEEGKTYEIKKISGKKGDKLKIDEILLFSENAETKVGKPLIKGAETEIEILEQKKGKKVSTYKYKAKSRYRKRYGKRPLYTVIKVNKIKA